jgi:esterase/lipase superfamily enzyme
MSPLEAIQAPVSEKADKVNLLAVTNRKPSQNSALLFSGFRGDENYYTDISVSIPPSENRKAGRIQWPKSRHPNTEKEFATLSVNQLDDAAINNWFSEKSAEHEGNFLIFVHGFNTPYDGGVFLLAQIIHDSNMKDAPILFSWPSRGKVLSYDYDRESATYSRTALTSLIEKLIKNDKVHKINIFAHSMGSWLTMESLRTIKLKDGSISPKINNIILASPDIDVLVFKNQYNDLGADAPPITILASKNDEALKLSRVIGGNIDRLGLVDFTKEPYKSAVNGLNLNVIDVTQVKGGGASEHLKFSESPEIVKLIGESLINGQKLSEDEANLNDQLGILIIGGAKEIAKGVGKVQKKRKRFSF